MINYKRELNAEQYEVVADGGGHCLVLAGAGSGKTRTLVYRVAYLIESGVNPSNILLLTFTNKAAKEMLFRVCDLLSANAVNAQASALWGGTFHHTGARILRRYAPLLGYAPNFNILDMEDAKRLMKVCVAEKGIPKNEKYFPKPEVLLSVKSFADNSQIPLEEMLYERFSNFPSQSMDQILSVLKEYQSKKKENNVMDFDDLLYNWRQILLEFPEVKKSLSEQFHYILVDEYQDTNIIQGSVIQYLSEAHKNLLVVGDDAQSIYAFRGATVSNILNFPKIYQGAKIFRLETNYRSTPEILALANASIACNAHQYKKQLKSCRDGGTRPFLVLAKNHYDQARFIGDKISRFQGDETRLSDIAVLFRSSFQIMELELELGRRGVPYIVRGGLRFFEQAHVKDMLGYLRIIANPKDEVSWRRVLLLYSGIGPNTVDKIWAVLREGGDLNRQIDALGALWVGGRATGSVKSVKELLENLAKSGIANISDCFKQILDCHYEDYLAANYDNAKERLADIMELARLASSYSGLEPFLEAMSLSESFKGEQGEESDRLILSTIHQAKGLEWRKVFVIGLIDGVFPHYKVFDNPKEMQEERRLFYVAATRAKEDLFCVYPVSSYSPAAGTKMNQPSLFLREVDPDLFNQIEDPYLSRQYLESSAALTGDEGDDLDNEDLESLSILDRIAKVNRQRNVV
ncbi:MAG: UvrD-helicase domain-containing protein [Parcubacteria group bacterium]|nr:UvrD-helicase domain-containing protein [Parcubacteria group bacterium]